MKKAKPEFGELYFSDLMGRAQKRAKIAEVFLGMGVMEIVKLLDAIAKEAYAVGYADALKDLRTTVEAEAKEATRLRDIPDGGFPRGARQSADYATGLSFAIGAVGKLKKGGKRGA